MNRSTFILGIALLIVAMTMAVTITVRNAPQQAEARRHSLESVRDRAAVTADRPQAFDSSMSATRSNGSRKSSPRTRFDVGIPAEALLSYSLDQQRELRKKVAVVEQKARIRLERMTEEFSLTQDQRRKMFPLLARSTPGFDPVMQVGGSASQADQSPTSADEEVYALLDPEQQEQYEDEEIDRQAWWQDVFSRLEQELLDSTGGSEITPAPEPQVPEAGSSAPTGRSGGNLLDLIE